MSMQQRMKPIPGIVLKLGWFFTFILIWRKVSWPLYLCIHQARNIGCPGEGADPWRGSHLWSISHQHSANLGERVSGGPGWPTSVPTIFHLLYHCCLLFHRVSSTYLGKLPQDSDYSLSLENLRRGRSVGWTVTLMLQPVSDLKLTFIISLPYCSFRFLPISSTSTGLHGLNRRAAQSLIPLVLVHLPNSNNSY